MTDTDTAAAQGFETLALHGGQEPDPTTNARAVPIYQTTSYVFDRRRPRRRPLRAEGVRQHLHADHEPDQRRLREARRRARGRRRRRSPSAPGSAAVTFGILNIAGAGDDIVSANSLYGGTYNLFVHTLPRFGLTSSSSTPTTRRTSAAPSSRTTKLLYAETVGNPKLDTLDIEAVADDRPRGRHPADRGQHDGDAVPHPADRPRRRHRRPLGDQVHRRPRHVHRRRDRRRGQVRLVANGRFPGLYRAGRQLPRAQVLRGARADRVHRQAAREPAARHRRGALARSTRSSSSRGSRRCRCAWSGTAPTRWPSPGSWRPTRRWPGSATRAWSATSRMRPRAQYHYRGLFGAIVGFGDQGRPRGGPALRREHAALLAPRQHRRRQVAGHPPGDDDALAADAEEQLARRRHRRLRAAHRRHRDHRRHHRRPRPGAGEGLSGTTGRRGGVAQAPPPAAPASARIWTAMTEKKPAARKEIGDVAMGYDDDAGNAGVVRTRHVTFDQPGQELALEGGGTLAPFTLAYETYGTLSERKDNAVLVTHALSGDAHVAGPPQRQRQAPGLVGHDDRPRQGPRHRQVLRHLRQRHRRLQRHHGARRPRTRPPASPTAPTSR